MTDDRAWNREKMPDTAQLVADAQALFADFGPLKVLYAAESGWEVGMASDETDVGQIETRNGSKITIRKSKARYVGTRAEKRMSA